MTFQSNATSWDVRSKVSEPVSQSISTASSVSKKRKTSSQIKFYGVKLGHTPGVYLNWKDCEHNITGFKNASFKSFSTHDEAEAYVAGCEKSSNSGSSSGVGKFYGVARGRIPGVYTDWAAAQEQITGWKAPKYKKFGTKNEAEAFVRDGCETKPKIMAAAEGSTATQEGLFTSELVSGDCFDNHRGPKKAKLSLSKSESLQDKMAAGTSKLQINIHVSAMSPMAEKNAEVLRIYTDGSSLGNGKDGARAGLSTCAVNQLSCEAQKNLKLLSVSKVRFSADRAKRNLSERLPGVPQTNQRAELTAILRALEISPQNHEVHIVTDSEYSINCVTKWYKVWERNNWVTSVKRPVLNKDLIQGVLAKIKDREALGTATRFFWVKGHSKDPGNEAADKLAVIGAQLPHLD